VNKKSILIVILSCFIFFIARAQGGQVLVLKEKGVTVKTFTVGSYINIQFSNYQWITGYISKINKDSIEIKQFALQPALSAYGTIGEDTLKLGAFTFNMNEIKAFAKEKGRYKSVFANGAFLQSAGALYAVLNMVNSIIRKEAVFDKNNSPKIAGGVVVWLLGKFQAKYNPDYRPIGKRYSVEIL
jgi:hypothetical protein